MPYAARPFDPYFARCLQLARKAAAATGANPLVGAVLVAEDGQTILGEGYHKQYGGPHAEVEALRQARAHFGEDAIRAGTFYVSLEPCNHYGKTPPCVDHILEAGIRRVAIGCLDPNPRTNGAGAARLVSQGVTVEVCETPGPFLDLIRPFAISLRKRRPYVALKWAETANGFIGRSQGERLLISGAQALRYGHSLRARYPAILVGKNTVLRDDPSLTLRYFPGPQPLPIVLDAHRALPDDLRLFRGPQKPVILNTRQDAWLPDRRDFRPEHPEAFIKLRFLLEDLYERLHVGAVLVEGGRYVLQQFINQELYDELHVLRSDRRVPDADVAAPVLPYNVKFDRIERMGMDTLFFRQTPASA